MKNFIILTVFLSMTNICYGMNYKYSCTINPSESTANSFLNSVVIQKSGGSLMVDGLPFIDNRIEFANIYQVDSTQNDFLKLFRLNNDADYPEYLIVMENSHITVVVKNSPNDDHLNAVMRGSCTKK